MLKRWLFDTRNLSKRTFIWNMTANIVFSLQSVVLLLIVSRFGSLNEAGVFVIIYTTTHMLSTIGNFNMRNYQVSDIGNEYSFSDYWTSRVITCVLMSIVGVIYGLTRFKTDDLLLVVMLFVGYRVTDGLEDVIHGLIQKEGRLDSASAFKTIRIVLGTLAFSGIYIIFRNIVFASLALLIVSSLFLLISVCVFNSVFASLNYHLQFTNIFKLLWVCLPLCLSALIQNYIINSPKYAIDKLLLSESQAIFNILFMPVFCINLLGMFIFNPLIFKWSALWQEGNIKGLVIQIRTQVLIVAGATLIASLFSYWVGCELLGFIYGVNLKEHKTFLMILMLFGGVTALVTLANIILTIIRGQRIIIFAHLVALLFNFHLSSPMIDEYGMEGAGYLYGLLMIIICILLSIGLIIKLIKRDKFNIQEYKPK